MSTLLCDDSSPPYLKWFIFHLPIAFRLCSQDVRVKMIEMDRELHMAVNEDNFPFKQLLNIQYSTFRDGLILAIGSPTWDKSDDQLKVLLLKALKPTYNQCQFKEIKLSRARDLVTLIQASKFSYGRFHKEEFDDEGIDGLVSEYVMYE